MRAHWNTCGRVSQVEKLGYLVVHAWLGKGHRLGMPADVQACWCDSTTHAWRFFPSKLRSRWQWCYLMMSLTSFLCRSREGIRESVHKTGEFLSLLVLGPFGSFPGWSIQEATDPLTQLPQCLSRSETITRQVSVLYLFNCMCLRLSSASWVSVLQLLASQLGILPPCIYLTRYQKGKDHQPLEWNSTHGINCDLSEPTESLQ